MQNTVVCQFLARYCMQTNLFAASAGTHLEYAWLKHFCILNIIYIHSETSIFVYSECTGRVGNLYTFFQPHC